MTTSHSPAVVLTGTEARIFRSARKGFGVPGPGALVTSRERTAREYIARRGATWVFGTLVTGVAVTAIVLVASTYTGYDPSESEAWLFTMLVFGGWCLVLSPIAWVRQQWRLEAELGPLDAPRRNFRAEPDALVILTPGGAARLLRYVDVVRCRVDGYGGKDSFITALTIDDGHGPVTLARDWLDRSQLLAAVADRLWRAGAVVDEV